MLILIQRTTPVAALRRAPCLLLPCLLLPCLIFQGILGGFGQGSLSWLLNSWIIVRSPVLGRCVNLPAISCSWQTSSSQSLAQPSQHVKKCGFTALALDQSSMRENPSFSTNPIWLQPVNTKRPSRVFYPMRWKEVENLHFLFLCFSVSFRLDIKTHCSIWGGNCCEKLGQKYSWKHLSLGN